MRAHAGHERLGKYRLADRLGEGGMGVVYLATDSSGQPVAVKVLRQGVPSEATARRRLAREVETMQRVHSPFVAEVIDADVEGRPPYIVTRYVAGQTLEKVVATDGPLSGAALVNLASGLSAALAAVHSAGVVHRDLKPGNVMLVDGQPVVIDFGIAQAPDSTRLTMTGMFMGTPGYLAPEVIEGRVGGAAADVHSWGATMAYAATGRPPFGTGQFEAIFYRIVHGQPDLEGMPPALLPIVASALARDPARRPTAADLHEFAVSLDPSALVPAATTPAAVLAAAVGPGQVAAGQPVRARQPESADDAERTIAARAGALPLADPTVQDYAAGPAADGRPAAAGGRVAWVDTRPLAAQLPADFADLLTPVQYSQHNGRPAQVPGAVVNGNGAARPAEPTPPAGLAVQQPSYPATPDRAKAAGPAPSRWPLVLATMAILVAVGVLLPIAGTAVALVVLLALRAADLTAGWLGRRDQLQGRSASQVAGAVAYFPVAVFRSALRFIALAPLALLCAGAAAVLAMLVGGASSLPRAGALAAGAVIACYCLGPGSGACRRPLSRAYGSLTRSTLAGVAGGIGLVAVAAAVVITATSLGPGYWPAMHLGNQLQAANVDHTALGRLPGQIASVGRHVLRWLHLP